MEYTSRRNKGFRIGIRVMGLVFMLGSGAYIIHSVTKAGIGPFRILTLMIAFVFFMVGFTYVKQSLGLSAYDVTYRILPEHLLLVSEKKEVTLEYDSIFKVELTKPRDNLDYYMLHIVSGTYNLVMHVEGQGELAEKMYHKLLEYTNL